jgi:hypothetical protein
MTRSKEKIGSLTGNEKIKIGKFGLDFLFFSLVVRDAQLARKKGLIHSRIGRRIWVQFTYRKEIWCRIYWLLYVIILTNF